MLGELLQAGRITRARENRPHAELCQRRRGENDIDHDGEAARGSPARACELQPMRDASWAEPREARARGGTATGGGARGRAPARGIGKTKIIFLFLAEIFLRKIVVSSGKTLLEG